MVIRFQTHGRSNGSARGPASALLTMLLLTAVAGCGTKHTEQAATGSSSSAEPSAQATVVASVEDVAPSHARASRPAGPVHRITLTNRRCIRFEPQWTSVRVGQSVTWHSDLKSPIRIYVSPGVFAKASFLVRPGGTVTTGPARSVGRFSFWTEPTACREAPRGVLLAGPGVRVQETYYASTGPR